MVDKPDEVKTGSSVLNKEQNSPELVSKSNVSNSPSGSKEISGSKKMLGREFLMEVL